MWVPAGVGGLEELAVGHLLARGQEGALQRHRGTLYRGTEVHSTEAHLEVYCSEAHLEVYCTEVQHTLYRGKV